MRVVVMVYYLCHQPTVLLLIRVVAQPYSLLWGFIVSKF
jgi:hypothetical protein